MQRFITRVSVLRSYRPLATRVLAFRGYSNVPGKGSVGESVSQTMEETAAGAKPEDNFALDDFDDLNKDKRFHPQVMESVRRWGFKKLTDVQKQLILPILDEPNGVVVRAKTGTGKTLAFVLPTVQTGLACSDFASHKKIQTLVIAPTRDLANQILDEYFKLTRRLIHSKTRQLETLLLIGGKFTNRKELSRNGIVVATPGKLLDLLRTEPAFLKRFSDLKYRVYDEADRLLEQGFEETLDEIDALLRDASADAIHPGSKFRSLLFSATLDARVDRFARDHIANDYTYIDCVKTTQEAQEKVSQTLVRTQNMAESHIGALSKSLKMLQEPKFKGMLFAPTITAADFLHQYLISATRNGAFKKSPESRYGRVFKLHGKMSQSARKQAIFNFSQSENSLLVCTDVAARGLDIPNVTDVILFTSSPQVADYVHKVGRTARAGKSGNATFFCTKEELLYVRKLQKERGISYAVDEQYSTYLEDEAELLKTARADEVLLETYITSVTGFIKAISSVHRLRFDNMIEQCFQLYQVLLQDPAAKLRMNKNFFDKNLGLPRRIADKYIEFSGGYREAAPSNNRASKRTFMDESNDRSFGYSNDRRSNDRRSSYSNDRRSGYNDRSSGYNDRRSSYSNDRRSNYSNDRRSNDRKSNYQRGERSNYNSDY